MPQRRADPNSRAEKGVDPDLDQATSFSLCGATPCCNGELYLSILDSHVDPSSERLARAADAAGWSADAAGWSADAAGWSADAAGWSADPATGRSRRPRRQYRGLAGSLRRSAPTRRSTRAAHRRTPHSGNQRARYRAAGAIRPGEVAESVLLCRRARGRASRNSHQPQLVAAPAVGGNRQVSRFSRSLMSSMGPLVQSPCPGKTYSKWRPEQARRRRER